MAVSATITNPQNDSEDKLEIPIATQAFFNEYWKPAIENTQGAFVTGFIYGIDIEKDDMEDLFAQLDEIRIWATEHLSGDSLKHMLTRIDLLIDGISTAFRRDDAKVFIG